MIEEIEIKIWGQVAGYAVYKASRLVYFEYDSKFPLAYDLAPLMMPRSVTQAWSFDLNEATYHGLPGLLADSLPDKYGTQMIDLWFSKNGMALGQVTALDRLCYLGSRAMGALEFFPNYDTKFQDQNLDVAKLIDLSAQILSERMNVKASLEDMATVLQIGSSAGGARAKAVIAFNPKTLEIRSGQVQHGSGFQDWIIKFDGLTLEGLSDPLGYTNIEYAYHLMARDCGIEMMESRLYEEHGRYHFLTKRFDRVDGEKLHMQTMCALAHLDYNEPRTASYETLFRISNFLQLNAKERQQLFRRMVFNVVASNHDDHTKNFSFLMDQSGKWSLAPAYDLTYSYRPDHYWLKEHNLLINGKSENFTREDLLQLARSFHIKDANDLIDEITQICSGFKTYAKKAKVSKENMALIVKNILGVV